MTIWSALFASVVVFATVATALRPSFLQQSNEGVDFLTWIALGMALVGLLASRVLPNLGKPMPGATPDAVGVGRIIIGSALNEGSALLAVVVWMLGGRMLALVALAISLVGLLLAFPSAARWQSLCRSSELGARRAPEPARPLALLQATGPSRKGPMPTEEELKAELEKLKAENAALKARGSKGLSMKVSEKGAVSVYGLGRFPVTLYQEQWLKLLDVAEDIRGFIRGNEGRLKKKE